MKRTLAWISLVACAALIPSLAASGERPVESPMPTAERLYGFDAYHRAPGNPSAPTRRSLPAEAIGRPERPPNGGGENLGSPAETCAGMTTEPENTGEVQATTDESAFVVPTWSGVFWIMPPGGLTRFLIPQPMPIDPERSLAPTGS